MRHYTDYPSFSEALVGFVQQARRAGFSVGIQGSKDTVAAALADLWLDRDIFEHALTALMVQDPADRESFSTLYRRFWRQRGSAVSDKRTYRNKKTVVKKGQQTAVMLGRGKTDEGRQSEGAKTTSGASRREQIKHTDFRKLSLPDSQLLDELSEKLIREMSLRLKRRRRKAKRGRVDIAQSIRRNLQRGGMILDLAHTAPKREKFRLLILLDISGSMDKYSFYLLKFLWALRHHFAQVEAFAFSTKLMRITDYLLAKDREWSLHLVSQYVTHWSSGTKIGECLRTFNEQYAKRFLNGKTLTIVLSDGLDTGEPQVLAEAMEKIKLRSKKLIWLNPLKGMSGYQPIQRGMKAALPAVQHFGSAHNFASLLALENILADA
ncbi:MAG: VWA domain-containing protein [Bacteroidota bacterium]